MGEFEMRKRKKSFSDRFQDLFFDVAKVYSKEKVMKYIEKRILKQVRAEVKKYSMKLAGVLALSVGFLFVLYAGFDIFMQALSLPNYLTNLFFGLFVVFVGLIIILLA